jgi:hypothetical protein
MLRHPVFIHGSETWTTKAEDKPRITTAETNSEARQKIHAENTNWTKPFWTNDWRTNLRASNIQRTATHWFSILVGYRREIPWTNESRDQLGQENKGNREERVGTESGHLKVRLLDS